MTEWLLGLVPLWGPWLVAVATFLSCLALPIPSSIIMLAAGGFVASGDLSLPGIATAALVGAVAGDQTGYFAARHGSKLALRLAGSPERAALVDRAERYLARRGPVAVFLSRWLVSPLGPWVNLIAGAARMPWPLFALAGLAGEAVWVGLYVGMGYAFSGSLEAATDAIGSLLGLVFALALAIGLGIWLVRASHRPGE